MQFFTLLTILITYATYNTNTYTTYNNYNIIRLLTRLKILAQRNQAYLQCIKRKIIKDQLTPVGNLNSEIELKKIYTVYKRLELASYFLNRKKNGSFGRTINAIGTRTVGKN